MATYRKPIRLRLLGLPVIEDLDDLSEHTRLSKQLLWGLSKNSEKHYKEFTIPKKSGGSRRISHPSKQLKGIQAWILKNILDNLNSSNSCKGFEKRTTILDNALPHIGQSVVGSIDIEDFFQSIPAFKVHSVFRSIGYNGFVSSILTRYCVYKDSLPQGGPCSPKLSNLVCVNLDNRIQGLVGRRGIAYTRYADDMTFSGLAPYKVIRILPVVEKIIDSEGFALNHKKTRITGITRAQKVTGLVVNDRSAGIGTKRYKSVRGKIHRLTYSRESKNQELLLEVQGWLAFLKSVDSKHYNKAKQYVNKLKSHNTNGNKLIMRLLQ